jgi:P27 family predicted phage terminase small subunit
LALRRLFVHLEVEWSGRMRGRKPTPSALKAIGPRSHHKTTPGDEPATEDPGVAFDTPPPELVGAAAAEWTRLAPLLRQRRQIDESDRSALHALCVEWAIYKDATRKMLEAGFVVKGPHGFAQRNPYRVIARDAFANCAKLWPELGLTPSSRSRVKTIGPPPANKIQRFMASGPKLRVVKA